MLLSRLVALGLAEKHTRAFTALHTDRFGDVYNEILGSLRRYVCYSWDERLYHLSASYVLYTYFHDFFTVAPRLFFLGPYGTERASN